MTVFATALVAAARSFGHTRIEAIGLIANGLRRPKSTETLWLPTLLIDPTLSRQRSFARVIRETEIRFATFVPTTRRHSNRGAGNTVSRLVGNAVCGLLLGRHLGRSWRWKSVF